MFQAVGMGNNFYTNSLGKGYPYMSNCDTEILAYNGFFFGYQNGMTGRIETLVKKIAGVIYQLTQSLQNPNLTANEKKEIKEEIKNLQKLIKQVNAGLVNLPTPEQMVQVEKGVNVALLNAMAKQKNQEAAQGNAGDDGFDVGSLVNDGSDTGSLVNGGSDAEDETQVSEEAAKKAKKEQEKQKAEALEIINGIYSATEGYSQWYNPDNDIDYPKLREAAKKINKDNVANVIVYWEEQLGSSKGKSLVKALFGGEHLWNPSLHNKENLSQDKLQNNSNANNMDILWNITVCLKQKAKELGIYNDLAGQFTVAFDELDDTCVDEEAVDNALKAIATAIYTKQTENLAESAQKTVDAATETDNKKNAEKRKKEVIAQKKQEFQNDLRTEYKLGKKLPELKAGFKVITDDNGEFKEYEVTIPGYTPFKGKSFEDIIAQLEEYDIDPEKALIKKVDTKA